MSNRLLDTVRFDIMSFNLAANATERRQILPYILSSTIASLAPTWALEGMAFLWGIFRYVTQPDRRKWARDGQRLTGNGTLGRVGLEIRTIGSFVAYVKFWLELLATPVADERRISRNLRQDGIESLREHVENKAGIIVATAHLGNPDWGGYYLSSFVKNTSTVVAPLKPPIFEKWVYRLRSQRGLESIPLSGPVTKGILQKLKEGHIVAIACDFDMSGTAIEVDLFGHTVPFASGPAVISLRTGVPIVPAAFFMTPRGGHLIKALDPLWPQEVGGESKQDKVRNLTQKLAKQMEQLISIAPEQWHVVIPLDIQSRAESSGSDLRKGETRENSHEKV